MTIAYFIVAIVILLAGLFAMFVFFDQEGEPDSFIEGLRIVSLFTAGSWLLAIAWPVWLSLLLPALVLYGIITGFKVLNKKTVTY